MSYPVKYLLPLKQLKKQLKQNPNLINQYRKYDNFVGDDDSIEFIIKKLKK